MARGGSRLTGARSAIAIGAATAAGGAAVAGSRRATLLRRDIEALDELGRGLALAADGRVPLGAAARRLLAADALVQLAALDNQLVSCVITGIPLAPITVAVDDPDSPAARAFRSQAPVLSDIDPRTAPAALREARVASVLAVPVTRGPERLGVVCWMWRRRRRRLSARERRLATLVGTIKGLLVGGWEIVAEAQHLTRCQVRRAVARQLDASIAHEMAVLHTSIQASAHDIASDPESVAELLPHILRHVALAEREIAEVLDALRAGPTVHLGLADVIGPPVAAFHASCPDVAMTVQTTIGYDDHVIPAVRETAYFVLREALDNAAGHAHARNVHVALTADADCITLVVRDDGRGFDLAAARPEPDGLLAMHERTRRAGGRLEVASSRGEGTTVTLRIPHPRHAPLPTLRASL